MLDSKTSSTPFRFSLDECDWPFRTSRREPNRFSFWSLPKLKPLSDMRKPLPIRLNFAPCSVSNSEFSSRCLLLGDEDCLTKELSSSELPLATIKALYPGLAVIYLWTTAGTFMMLTRNTRLCAIPLTTCCRLIHCTYRDLQNRLPLFLYISSFSTPHWTWAPCNYLT